MKKIMVYAYTKGNLGDDLFVKLLCDRYPDTKFYINTSNQYNQGKEDIPNLILVSREKPIIKIINYTFIKLKLSHNIVKKIMALTCDASVYIGGSLYMQSSAWKSTIEYNKNMKIKGKPFYLLGINFGPYSDQLFLDEHIKIFSEYTDVCVRDKETYDLLKAVNNIRYAPDIIFSLPDQLKIDSNNNEKYIVISVINLENRKDLSLYKDAYENWIGEMAQKFAGNGYKVYMMSFCQFEGDENAIKRIYDNLTEAVERVDVFFYRGNINESLSLIANASLFIATRFHAMILGFRYGIPTLPITYSKKMDNVLRDMDYKGKYTSIKNISELNYYEVHEIMENNVGSYEELATRAEEHFYVLDNYLR